MIAVARSTIGEIRQMPHQMAKQSQHLRVVPRHVRGENLQTLEARRHGKQADARIGQREKLRLQCGGGGQAGPVGALSYTQLTLPTTALR